LAAWERARIRVLAKISAGKSIMRDLRDYLRKILPVAAPSELLAAAKGQRRVNDVVAVAQTAAKRVIYSTGVAYSAAICAVIVSVWRTLELPTEEAWRFVLLQGTIH